MGERPTRGLLSFQKGNPMNSADRLTTSQGTFFLSACFAGLATLSYVFHDGGAPTQYAAFFAVSLTALAAALISFPFRAAGDVAADSDLEAVAEAVGVLVPTAAVPAVVGIQERPSEMPPLSA